MSDQYLGEIRTVGFNFAPQGWATCDGQILPIAQNTALFSLLGTYYGGDGKTTFALPNLNRTFAIGQGRGPGLTERALGEMGGVSTVTLTQSEMPLHTHVANAVAAAGNSGDPEGRVWAEPRYGRAVRPAYAATGGQVMAADALTAAGGNQPHENMPPFLTMTFVIAMTGIFPPRG